MGAEYNVSPPPRRHLSQMHGINYTHSIQGKADLTKIMLMPKGAPPPLNLPLAPGVAIKGYTSRPFLVLPHNYHLIVLQHIIINDALVTCVFLS